MIQFYDIMATILSNLRKAMKIYLIRHAQSEANVDYTVLHQKTNVGVHLTDIGQEQAKQTGTFIAEQLKEESGSIMFWNSPYERTRLTANALKHQLDQDGIKYNSAESIYIAERQFGILDDNPNFKTSHEAEYKHFLLHKENKHDFFVRPPLGESPFDMCMRLDFFIRTVLTQSKDDVHIIVSHGASIRGFIMMQQHWQYEEYMKMVNPYNASVHFIDDKNTYHGQIFAPEYKTV